MIPYGKQDIDRQDIEAVVEVLKSDFLTQGPAVPAFEQAVADYCRAPYAVAVNSGTSALHLACRALALGPGDWLWTSPNTFVASANCGRYCGADVDFVDIDPHTLNMSISALEQKLQQAEQQGRLPKVVVPVHFAGQSCDMQQIAALAERYGFAVIEDASHAIGACYQGRAVGSCQYADITVFSFHPVKVITSGEGGMALTRHQDVFKKMQQLRSHGITRDAAEMTHAADGDWYYQQLDLGYNYRMTDMQAALGVSQMRRLGHFVAQRRELAKRYDQLLRELPLILPYCVEDRESAWHLYVVQVDSKRCKTSRKQVFDGLRAKGIGVNVHYIPAHTQPYYQKLGFAQGDFPQAEAYYANAISLPLYPGMNHESQDYIVNCLRALFP